MTYMRPLMRGSALYLLQTLMNLIFSVDFVMWL